MVDHHRRAEAGSHPSRTQTPTPQVRLSCELCRQRKVKCDKLNPCTNCRRLGVACVLVERARLPRGRSGRLTKEAPESDPELRERVSRLEALIRNISESEGLDDTTRSIASSMDASKTWTKGLSPVNSSPVNVDAQTPEMHTGNPYWRKDTSKQGVYASGNNNLDLSKGDSPSGQSETYQRLFTMAGNNHPRESGLPVLGGALASREAERELFRIFLYRVDPFFKILHQPSLSSYMLDGKCYLEYEPGHLVPIALSYAIYYVAACSLDEEECRHIFKRSRTTVVEFYRKESETSLGRVDFMTSNDLTVLQAFVLSLLASRTQDQTRRTWTMLSVALRIAQALYLHQPEAPFTVRPFEREMRRRLWTAIGFLDVESSLDRASEPMMQSAWLESHPPLNINDSDINFDMKTTPITQSEGFTDMTFTMIALKAQNVSRLVNFSGFTEKTVNSIAMRQHLVIDFQHSASRLLQHGQPDKVAFHWFTRAVAELINSSMQLITLRPLQRMPGFVPPPVRGDRLLQLAVDVLRKSHNLRNDPRSLSWHWIKYTFVPWHPLAVALAELCECDDLALLEKFWAPVDQAYERLGGLIAGSRNGALWKPMEKMMTQVNTKRAELLSKSTVSKYPSTFRGPTSSQAPVCSLSDTRTSLTLAPLMDQNSEIYAPTTIGGTIPRSEGLGPWPCVWDAIDFGNAGVENEMSWLNYENFIGGFYENIDYSLIMPLNN